MTTEDQNRPNEAFMQNAMASFLRIGILLLLIVYCLRIVGPFINMTLWAMIIAVAIYPLHLKLASMLGGREKWSATLIVLLGLAVLIVPVEIAAESGIESAKNLAGELRSGKLSIPPPNEKVAGWPIIGKKVYSVWTDASQNLQEALNQFRPQLITAGEALLKGIGNAAGGILAFMASLIIAGVFLVSADPCYRFAKRFMTSLAGDVGPSLTDLSIQTIRSVAKGVLGVAVIQTLLAAIGLFAMGVPAAGIFVAVLLMLAIMQIPTIIVIAPVIIWVYSFAEPGPATIFAIYMLLVGLSDNVLKPLMLGRGVEIPMLVILLGAIGGAIYAGVIGLFLGAVVLALGYQLLDAWIQPESLEETLAEAKSQE